MADSDPDDYGQVLHPRRQEAAMIYNSTLRRARTKIVPNFYWSAALQGLASNSAQHLQNLCCSWILTSMCARQQSRKSKSSNQSSEQPLKSSIPPGMSHWETKSPLSLAQLSPCEFCFSTYESQTFLPVYLPCRKVLNLIQPGWNLGGKLDLHHSH